MKSKPIVPRKLAKQDVDAAVDHYLREGRRQAALGVIEALKGAYSHIGRQPDGGSPCYARDRNVLGLPFWSLIRYLGLVFYIERADHIDVWRVLHSQRDMLAWMSDPNGDKP